MEELAAFATAGRDQSTNAAIEQDCSSSGGWSSGGSADSSWEPDPDDAGSAEDENEHDEALSGDGGLDTSIILIDGDLRSKVSRLIQEDACKKKCLEGKTSQLEQFLCSLSQMSSSERKQNILTALAVLKETDTVQRHRGYGLREQFHYYLLLVGHVCRAAWCAAYGVSPPTVTRYRNRINDGIFSVKAHGNRLNQNASAVDLRWLISWFTDFAKSVGEVVPVRVRKRATVDGVVKLQYSSADYTLLPAYFTWEQLYTEMHNYVEEIRLRVREPRPSTFRHLLREHCPTIRIKSQRSNVCDVCSIYCARMRSGVTAELTEELGRHTEAARHMRFVLLCSWDTRIILIYSYGY